MENADYLLIPTHEMRWETDRHLHNELFPIIGGLLLGYLCMKAVRLAAVVAGVAIIMLESLRQAGYVEDYGWEGLIALGTDTYGQLGRICDADAMPLVMMQRGFVGGIMLGASFT